MGLLKKATMGTAYAKIGILGFAGSGKTFTAAKLARGICEVSKNKKIAFFDTEKGSDFLVKPLHDEGYEFFVHKSKSFADLTAIIKEAEADGFCVLIIDSISHVWAEILKSYMKQNNIKVMRPQHWATPKQQWQTGFTEIYINSKLHIIMCGRAANEWGSQENEETGKLEMISTGGMKMKVEGETGYEPDLLIEMEAIKGKDSILNQAFIVKDRSNTLNGKTIDKPDFAKMKSFFDYLSIGGTHEGIDLTRNSEELFDKPDWSPKNMERRREIALEQIQSACILAGISGTSAEAKKKWVLMLQDVFKTTSWREVELMKAQDLEDNLQDLKVYLGQVNPLQEPPKADMTEKIQ